MVFSKTSVVFFGITDLLLNDYFRCLTKTVSLLQKENKVKSSKQQNVYASFNGATFWVYCSNLLCIHRIIIKIFNLGALIK